MADSEVKLSVADAAGLTEVGLEQWLHMYEQMARIRAFEEQGNQLYLSAKMPGLRDIAVAKADRCTSPIRRRATWAPTPSSAGAPGSPPAPPSRPRGLGKGGWLCVSSAREPSDKGCSTK